LGALRVYVGDQKLSETGLFALEDVVQAGLLYRSLDAIRLWIQ
jgi:hypothetical protein